jgi:immune inhibitor A
LLKEKYMRKKLFSLCAALMLLSSLLVTLTTAPRPVASQAGSVESLTMFRAAKFNAHYRLPHQAEIERLLQKAGLLRAGAPQAEIKPVVQKFVQEWNERNPITANPVKLRQLLERERLADLTNTVSTQDVEQEIEIKSLVVPVGFPGQDTFDWCGDTVTTVGPLHNQIAPPGTRDNNTVWYEDTSPELYTELYFGVGPDAGVIVNHPNLGPVDLRGNTMANYYLEQSEGAFVPTGMVYPKWLQATHSEGWYGADSCDGGNNNVRAQELVAEAVELLKADDPTFPWQNFDGDGDGIVDNFTVIHAGIGQESGGGDQGSFAIWSHASLIEWPSGHLACEAPSAGCPDRNIYVREYSMDPENIDVGVISEEFGHAAFGLPDLYTNDYSNSIAFWSIMSGGAWNGPLGGMQPAPFPLWFRYLIGWSAPLEFDYDTGPAVDRTGTQDQPARPGDHLP